MSPASAHPMTVELASLMSPSGVGYSALAEHLAGGEVRFEAPLYRDRLGAVGVGLLSPGCSHAGSEIGILICDPPPTLALIANGTVIRIRGTLEYGFATDEHGTATYLRLRHSSLDLASDLS